MDAGSVVTAQSLLERKIPWVPSFPITRPGLFMHYLHDCYVAMVGEGLDQAGWELFIESTRQAVVQTPDWVRVGSLFHAKGGPWWNGLSLGQKTACLRQMAEIETPNKEKLKLTVAATGHVLVNLLARTAVRTVRVFSPAPQPGTVALKAVDGYRFIARAVPSIQPHLSVILEAHRLAAQRFVPDLVDSVGVLRDERALAI